MLSVSNMSGDFSYKKRREEHIRAVESAKNEKIE